MQMLFLYECADAFKLVLLKSKVAIKRIGLSLLERLVSHETLSDLSLLKYFGFILNSVCKKYLIHIIVAVAYENQLSIYLFYLFINEAWKTNSMEL